MATTINGSAGVTTNSGAVYDGLQRGTVVTASGTSVDFTSIPAWVKRITVMFAGVSASGTSNYILQLGDSGGIANTDYTGSSASLGSTSTNGTASATSGLTILRSPTAADTYSGICTISNISANVWVISSNIYDLNAANTTVIVAGGSKTLSATLDRIRITTVNGTDTFDDGLINIIYE